MDVAHFWDEHSNIQRVKYESGNSNDETNRLKDERSLYPCCDGNLNFATAACSEDDSEYGPYKKNKVTRQDPMSHRIIEKRRRDRMNNCLADLSRLIPTEYLKKGRGRIEKTEIIEMAIKHMKYLQQGHTSSSEHYRLGYQECMSEAMRFMVEVEGHFPREAICMRLLNHLQKHCEAISRTGPIKTSSGDIASVHNQNEANVPNYQTPKSDPEMNNNVNSNNNFDTSERNHSESETFEKYDNNHASYKYKNDIKLRFNQDLNVQSKRQKMEQERRSSVTSLENQSSSYSSPPSSEVCTRISSESDNTNRISPTESSISLTNPLKSEPNRTDLQIYTTSNGKAPQTITTSDTKTNFNIPIFVLHSKGSFYVPLTIDYKTLLPFLQNYDLLEMVPNIHNIVLHPVTINVNFQPNYSVKSAKYPNAWN